MTSELPTGPGAEITVPPAAHSRPAAPKRDLAKIFNAIMDDLKAVNLIATSDNNGLFSTVTLAEILNEMGDRNHDQDNHYGANSGFSNLGLSEYLPIDRNTEEYNKETLKNWYQKLILTDANQKKFPIESLGEEESAEVYNRIFDDAEDTIGNVISTLCKSLDKIDKELLPTLILTHLLAAVPGQDASILIKNAQTALTNEFTNLQNSYMDAAAQHHISINISDLTNENSDTAIGNLEETPNRVETTYCIYEVHDEQKASVIQSLSEKMPILLATLDASMKKYQVGKYALPEHQIGEAKHC